MIVNVKETIDFIAGSEVELGIEAIAEPTPTKPESNMSSVADSSEATRAGEQQKSVDIAVAQKNKSDDAALETVSVDAAQENKSVDVAQKNKTDVNMPMNKSVKEKKKEKVHADVIVAAEEGVIGKNIEAPAEKTSSTSDVVAEKSESADLKNGTEAVNDILNVEKKATDVKDASGVTKETSEVEVKGAQAVEDILNVEKKAADVKEVVSAKKGTSDVEAKGAQAVEEILNVDQLTSLVKEALDIKKEVGEAKDKVSSAVKVEVKVPLATPEVSSLTKKVDLSPTDVDDEVVIVKEVIAKKFEDMTLSDNNSEEDEDYSLSEAESEDSLEWASETERTKAEDDLAEHKVGIDYIGAALDLATEKAASFKTVQAALAVGDWILSTAEGVAPGEVSAVLSSVRRRVRKIRRSGERTTGAFREPLNQSTLTVASLLSHPLSLLGWQLKPLVEAATKKVLLEEDLVEVEAELCNAETCTFEELNLSDYDSDLDADYSPSEESSSEDELEFNTDAEVSSVVDELELLA